MTENVSRRSLLGAGVAVGAGIVGSTLTAGAARAATAKAIDGGTITSGAVLTADAVVVGAGLSGLVAAQALAAGGKNVYVLEARNRVGGRVWDVALNNGGTIEVGGQFTGPTQTHLAALASSLGVSTFQGYSTGNNIFDSNGTLIQYTGALPPLSSTTQQALFGAIGQLDALAATVPVESPWTAPNAESLDAQTVSSWILANVTDPTAQQVLFLMVVGALSAEARDMSLLWFLFYVSASGDESDVGTLERLTGTIGGARDSRFVGGPMQIPLKLSAQLGSRVILNAPVSSISQSGSTATVCTGRFSIAASSVVVALPPTLAGRIAYNPAVPALRDQLTQRFPMSSIGKFLAIYPTPFWRAAGLTGQAYGTTGMVRSTFDNSPPDGSYGALLGFIDGDQMRFEDGATDAAFESLALSELTTYFGSQASNPTQIVIGRWDSEQYTRGGAPAFTAPGVLTRFGASLRQPVGLIHWAGAETSDFWPGHLEGAVRAGQRAASEILG